MYGFIAKVIKSQPMILGKAKINIVTLVPYLFLIIPDITQDIAEPRTIDKLTIRYSSNYNFMFI